MKKTVSIIIVSILIVSLAAVSIAELKGVSSLGFLNRKTSQGGVEDLKESSKLQDGLELKENELSEQLFRVDTQGDVALGITFLNPQEEDEDYLNFEIMLDTHSMDLDEYNLGEISTLFIGDEIKITEGIKWEVDTGSGHHILGYLQVPRKYKGEAIDYLEANFVELEIKELAGIASRKFKWEKSELTLSK